MLIKAKNDKQLVFRRLTSNDFAKLFEYLQNLSKHSKSHFGPHKFDLQSIIVFYEQCNNNIGYLALDNETQNIVAYSIIKIGLLDHDRPRLLSYGLILNEKKDCTFAPSVADLWQSYGIANALFHYILSDIKTIGIERIILWGGVQKENQKAFNFYVKNGFRTIGQFSHEGENFDMILDIFESNLG